MKYSCLRILVGWRSKIDPCRKETRYLQNLFSAIITKRNLIVFKLRPIIILRGTSSPKTERLGTTNTEGSQNGNLRLFSFVPSQRKHFWLVRGVEEGKDGDPVEYVGIHVISWPNMPPPLEHGIAYYYEKEEIFVIFVLVVWSRIGR